MHRRIAIALLSVAAAFGPPLAFAQQQAGDQLLSYAIGARYYVESPAGGPDWGVRFVVTLLYPK